MHAAVPVQTSFPQGTDTTLVQSNRIAPLRIRPLQRFILVIVIVPGVLEPTRITKSQRKDVKKLLRKKAQETSEATTD